MMRRIFVITAFSMLILTSSLYAQETSFTQEDRDRLIRLEATLQEFKDSTDKRFEQVDKRFAELREDMNKRNDELREDMNKRNDELREDMNKRNAELREDINKRFEQVDKRFEQMFSFLWILTGIFTTLTIGVIGFAYWDRKTAIRKAKEETIEEIERDGRLRDLINALRELAETDTKVETVLRKFHLL